MISVFPSSLFRRLLIPSAVLAKAVEPEECPPQLLRPSELPIYIQEPPKEPPKIRYYGEEEDTIVIAGPSNALQEAFRTVRTTLSGYVDELKAYERVGIDRIKESRESVDGFITYLQQEENTIPRAGAIGVGSLAGYILGLRGGLFRRLFYGTLGGLGMAAICYPNEAAEYTEMGLTESKKLFIIAYNFIYGVKKDDPPLALPSLPKLPSSFPEAWDTVKQTALSFVSDGAASEEKIVIETVKPPKEKDAK